MASTDIYDLVILPELLHVHVILCYKYTQSHGSILEYVYFVQIELVCVYSVCYVLVWCRIC